jgi:hypothetical protein
MIPMIASRRRGSAPIARTSSEAGVGLGVLTLALRPDHRSPRFDQFAAACGVNFV